MFFSRKEERETQRKLHSTTLYVKKRKSMKNSDASAKMESIAVLKKLITSRMFYIWER